MGEIVSFPLTEERYFRLSEVTGLYDRALEFSSYIARARDIGDYEGAARWERWLRQSERGEDIDFGFKLPD
jgi:hypothetical protein